MQSLIKSLFSITFTIITLTGYSQTPDTTAAPASKASKFFKNKYTKAFLAPALLIGYGASVIYDNGLYSSYAVQEDAAEALPGFHTKVDDYLQYVPYAAFAGVALFRVKCKNDFLNTCLLIAKSELLMVGSVYAVKNLSNIKRPDSGASNAFPSGHTAQAFVAAGIIDKELRDKSVWFSIGAYSIASSVGVLRVLNNRHWASDVIAGAGFGILSVNVVYLTHRNKWGRKMCNLPEINVTGNSCYVRYKF